MDNWIITGDKGFIGSRLRHIHGGMGYDLKAGQDIRNYIQLNDAIKGMDVVVHLAASPGVVQSINAPLMDFDHNVHGTINVLEAARQNKVRRVVLISSAAADDPKNPYGAAKGCMEAYAKAYSECYGMNILCLRFSNVYGPGSVDKDSCVALFCKQALHGDICVEGGQQERDFIHIDDVVNGIIAAAYSDIVGVINICSGKQYSIKHVADRIADKMQSKVRIATPRAGDHTPPPRSPAVVGEWHPIIELESGLDETIKYFEDLQRKETQALQYEC